MSDLFLPPNKIQMDRAREVYCDPIICWAVNAAVDALNQMKEQPTDYVDFSKKEYYRQTRLLVLNFGAGAVLEILYQAVEDLANDQFLNFEVPNLQEETKKSIDPTATAIAGKLKITEVAKRYGLEVKGNKAVCPFHDDKDPSLSFSNEKGLFNCFGCHVKGDIVTFVRKMEELKNGK